MTSKPPIPQFRPVVLTAAEYDALGPNSRVELVDGVVLSMTPATGRHQEIVERLKRVLEACCPDDLRVVREQELRLGDTHRRNPDLMVIAADAYDPDGFSYRPHQVRLAIEVVSPGTETIDRKHKPVEYAEAKVPHYWRVEPRPALAVHTYQLGETGVFLETGLFTDGDVMTAPGLAWAKIAVSDLAP
jgi:Uma2 family endonuclease